MRDADIRQVLRALRESFVVDNRRLGLGEAVSGLLGECSLAYIAVGYLFRSGFATLASAYAHPVDDFRLLLGPRTDKDTAALLSLGESVTAQKPGFLKRLVDRLLGRPGPEAEVPLDQEIMEAVKALGDKELLGLLWLLKAPQAKVRIYRRPPAYFHAKLYFFELPMGIPLAIAGSGNFSLSGLQDNVELNLAISQIDQADGLRRWFLERWEEAEDFAADLLEAVEMEYRRRMGQEPPEAPQVEVVAPEKAAVGKEAEVKVSWQHLQGVKVERAIEEMAWEIAVSVDGERESGEQGVGVGFPKKGRFYLRASGRDILGNRVTSAPVVVEVEEVPPPPPGVYTPFDVYLVTLYHLFGEAVAAEAEPGEPDFLKVKQREAATALVEILREHGIAVLADSVGLGKTVTALETARRWLGDGGRVLIIAPAELLVEKPTKGVWATWIERFGLNGRARTVSAETMGREFDPSRYRGYDLIIIDEAHWFRNRQTNRYARLNDLKGQNPGTPVLLVSATPIQNTAYDLHNALKVFLADDALRAKGIPSIETLFDQLDPDDVDSIEDLRQALRHFIIKRTRSSMEGEQFPERHIKVVDYELATTYGEGVLDKLIEILESLSFPHYEGVSELVRIILAKRLESSIPAFTKSLWAQKQRIEGFLGALEGRRRIEEEITPEVEDPDTQEMIDRAYEKAILRGEGIESFLAELRNELYRIETALHAIEGIPKDTKLDRLVEEVHRVRGQGKRLIIFTAFVDTALGIYERLRQEALGRVAVVTGRGCWDPDGKGREAQSLIRRFAPMSNQAEQDVKSEDMIDILVCTDMLSEGLNLQDVNTLISYDLPWNPMKLLQRQGRIDRLGNPHSDVYLYNFIPTNGLEELLSLMRRLVNKLKQARAAVGKEFKIISESEILDPIEFRDIIDRLLKGDTTLPDDLERRDVLGDPLDEYRQDLRMLIQQDPALLERARSLSEQMVLSAAQRDMKGFYVLAELLNHKVPVIVAQGAEPLTDWKEVLKIIRASVDEPVAAGVAVPASAKDFQEIELVRQAIARLEDDFRTGTFALVRRTRLQVEIINRLRQIGQRIAARRELKEKARSLSGVLLLGLKGFQERALRQVWREVKDERDEDVIRAIERACDRLGISQTVIVTSKPRLLGGEVLEKG